MAGRNFIEKRTFTNVIFYVRISQIQDRKIRNQNVHRGCIVSVGLLSFWVSIYHDVGYLELLILVKGNARALTWDRREVEHPRLSI